MQTAVSRAEERREATFYIQIFSSLDPSRAQQSLVPGSTTPSFMGAGAGAAAVVARWLVSEVEFLNFNINTFGKLLLWFSYR